MRTYKLPIDFCNSFILESYYDEIRFEGLTATSDKAVFV